jgi:hypothetical protein
MKDVALYFRGVLHSTRPTQIDPEQVLSLVPPESDLYYPAQELRLSNWSQSPVRLRLATGIADSLDRANARYRMYYSLRLVNRSLRYAGISILYDDFRGRHGNVFDFARMKSGVIRAVQGMPVDVNLTEVMRVEAATVLFLIRLIETAHAECLGKQKTDALTSYDALVKNENGNFDFELRSLAINPDVQSIAAQLRRQPLPCDSGPAS